MKINDKETQAIADLYREMIGEQVSGKSALTGKELVTALVTACMSKWYDLTSKFQARPEIYDVAPTDTNDAYNVMKLNPGSDVRDDAFEAIVKSTNDIAKELNRLFGKDVFEPRITRQHGKLEALVAFSANEGGVFQAKGDATEGHTTIHITMPKEAELERAFSAMTDTPHHGDVEDGQGVGELDDTLDADPIAGDPSPDYDPEFDVASDADQNEVDAALGGLDDEPAGDPMDDLSADEADAAFDDEPRRPRGRFEGLYLDAMDALTESNSTYKCLDAKGNVLSVVDGPSEAARIACKEAHGAECVNTKQNRDKLIGEASDSGISLDEVQKIHAAARNATLKKHRASSKDGITFIKVKNGDPNSVLNTYLSELTKAFGFEVRDVDEDLLINGTVLYTPYFQHGTPGDPYRGRYTVSLGRNLGRATDQRSDAVEAARKVDLKPTTFDPERALVDINGDWVRDEDGDLIDDKGNKIETSKEAASSYRIRVKGKDGDKVSKVFKSEGDADRERRTNPDFRGGTIEPVEEMQETAVMDREADPKVSKPGENSDPKKKPMPKKPCEKEEEEDKPRAKTFREFVDDKEDGTPGWSPRHESVPIDMDKVDKLESMFRRAIKKELENPSGGTVVGPQSNFVNGIDIETAQIVFHLNDEIFQPGQIDSYAKQVLSHWKKYVGGDEEFNVTHDALDNDTYRLRGCEYDGMTFDVYIQNSGEYEINVDRIRATDAALGESSIFEEAPGVSVGGAQAAGSSPAPEVVKDIGKKKKTRVRRRAEAVDSDMDAVNEALNRGLI